MCRSPIKPSSALTRRPRALSSQLVLLALFLYVQAATAQEGSISGVVETDDGTPLPYATIRLLDAPYGALTGEGGRYVLNSVPAGAYVLEVFHDRLRDRRRQHGSGRSG